MRAYIIRRILLMIPTLFLLTIVVFLSVRFIPGDVIDVMVGRMDQSATNIDREALEHLLGLDVPVWVQYGRWLGGVFLHGSLGESLMGRGAVEGADSRKAAGHPRAGCPRNPHRPGDRDARWHLLRRSPGYRRRLPGAVGPPSSAWPRRTSGWHLWSSSTRPSGSAGRHRRSWFPSPKTRWGIWRCSLFPA